VGQVKGQDRCACVVWFWVEESPTLCCLWFVCCHGSALSVGLHLLTGICRAVSCCAVL
jgi:hypothetical protein